MLLLFVGPLVLIGLLQYAGASRPDEPQRIAATLASWGLTLEGLSIPVSREQVDRQIGMLRSDISEDRVQAADWLAARGVRAAGAAIASAMVDPGTLRSCQLAHALGFLGDKRWAGLLVNATKHPTNLDLRVCATIALGKLQSPDTVDALIDVYKGGAAPTAALDALGKISHPAALDLLRSVVEQPRNDVERRSALRAIERIQIMQEPDVAMVLMQQIRTAASRGVVDKWAVRKLALLRDISAVPVLCESLITVANDGSDGRVVLAAALLAHGDPGIKSLRILANQADRLASCTATALAALTLVDGTRHIEIVSW